MELADREREREKSRQLPRQWRINRAYLLRDTRRFRFIIRLRFRFGFRFGFHLIARCFRDGAVLAHEHAPVGIVAARSQGRSWKQ